MRLLIVGDVHGRFEQLAEVLRQAQTDYRIEAALQVGDFGFYKDQLVRCRQEQLRYPVPLHAIDGNHEDHSWLRRASMIGIVRGWEQEFNLIYQARPSVARFGSSTVGFLGGALHVDRPQRHGWLGGFPNYLLRRHREEAVALFNEHRPELIVTHSCPAGIGIGLPRPPEMEPGVAQNILAAGFDPGPRDDCGEIELTRLWQELRHRPRAWAFGHFHRTLETVIDGTRFVSVSNDLDSPGRTLVLWDTEEKKLLHCLADPSAVWGSIDAPWPPPTE